MSKPVYDPVTERLYMTPSSAREAGHDPVTGRIFLAPISAQEAEEVMSRWRETHPEISAFWRDPSPLQAAMASPEPWPLDPVEKRRQAAPKGRPSAEAKYDTEPSLASIFRDPPEFDESLAWEVPKPKPKPGMWNGARTALVTREYLDALKKAVADNTQRMIQVCAERDTARTQLMEARAQLAKVARERKEARRAEHLAKAELKVALAAAEVPQPEPSNDFRVGDTLRFLLTSDEYRVASSFSPFARRKILSLDHVKGGFPVFIEVEDARRLVRQGVVVHLRSLTSEK